VCKTLLCKRITNEGKDYKTDGKGIFLVDKDVDKVVQ